MTSRAKSEAALIFGQFISDWQGGGFTTAHLQYTEYLVIFTGVPSNQDRMLCVKIRLYLGFWVHRGS